MAEVNTPTCCAPEAQATCCEPEAKGECCDATDDGCRCGCAKGAGVRA